MKGKISFMDKSLSHMMEVKYHIIFTPKYRRKIIYNKYIDSIKDVLKDLCKYKGVEIIEGHLIPHHLHMIVK